MTIRCAILPLALFCALQSFGALSFSNRYRSPRNPERQFRKATRLIVLHTTEAGARSSLNKLSERGEAHYCLDEKGVAYRIVDRDREAFHAGRSMWNGREECDKYSIGIEVVGHHDKPITLSQLESLRDLVAILKKEYSLSDAQVVCHSHVAYGAPNKWVRRNHRGRKRCGMLFAMPSVRRGLALKAKPAFDPDVRARRLIVGDEYLNRVLYGNVDTMAGRIGKNIESPSTSIWSKWFSGKKSVPTQSKSESKVSTKPAQTAKPKAASKPVAKPNGGKVVLKTLEDKKYFTEVGVVGKKNSPYKLAGKEWNSNHTYYYFNGSATSGEKINPKQIPNGARVFVRKK